VRAGPWPKLRQRPQAKTQRHKGFSDAVSYEDHVDVIHQTYRNLVCGFASACSSLPKTVLERTLSKLP
jgi:hypothetical protein